MQEGTMEASNICKVQDKVPLVGGHSILVGVKQSTLFPPPSSEPSVAERQSTVDKLGPFRSEIS